MRVALACDSRSCFTYARAGPLAREVLMTRREVVALLGIATARPLAAVAPELA